MKNIQSMRILLRGLVLCAALGVAWPGMAEALPQSAQLAASNSPRHEFPVVDVYKSALCGCCEAWAVHLQKSGFTVILHDVGDVPATRKQLGMPDQYGACHTAKVGQYLVEGHVPAADIKRLLRKHPKSIGLAVPSMPPSAPGMQGGSSIPYDTLLVSTDGTSITFTHHQTN